MRAQLASLAIAMPLLACGDRPEDAPPVEVDPSCGLDCASQQGYGLIVGRCFEYANPAVAPDELAIGAWVRPVEMLEGGRHVLPVDYSEGGQIRMTDRFFFQDGDLYLARRTFQSGQSVTYRDEAGNIVGVPWWQKDAKANQSFGDVVQGDVVNLSTRIIQRTTFRVSTLEPDPETEQTVPAGTFPTAIKLLFSETPAHGADTRRVFAEGTGFTLFAGPLQLVGGEAVEYRLLRIREVGTADGGNHPCGVVP